MSDKNLFALKKAIEQNMVLLQQIMGIFQQIDEHIQLIQPINDLKKAKQWSQLEMTQLYHGILLFGWDAFEYLATFVSRDVSAIKSKIKKIKDDIQCILIFVNYNFKDKPQKSAEFAKQLSTLNIPLSLVQFLVKDFIV
ncbi:Hypothetical_protein [Hexamita inflata]|uniref:Hypothetical_protein n=1 Tax=Hexamita inflata TaxID=28002 RepID=A0AA86QXG4_9EUKA|nr:Hypothetical protein HINF_LOCUS48954 [Hexamita inflata]